MLQPGSLAAQGGSGGETPEIELATEDGGYFFSTEVSDSLITEG